MRLICTGLLSIVLNTLLLGDDTAPTIPLPPNFVILGTYERQADVVCTYQIKGTFQFEGEKFADIGSIKPILKRSPKKDLLVVVIAKTSKTDTELKKITGFIAKQFHSIGFRRVVVRRASAGFDAWVLLDSALPARK